MANQQDLCNIRSNLDLFKEMEKATDCDLLVSWPILKIAMLVHVDCAIWKVSSMASDVIMMHPWVAFRLLQGDDVAIVDNGLCSLYNYRRPLTATRLRERTDLRKRMWNDRFAVQFDNAPSVPLNLRGEMLDIRVMSDAYITEHGASFGDIYTVNRDGTPVSRPELTLF